MTHRHKSGLLRSRRLCLIINLAGLLLVSSFLVAGNPSEDGIISPKVSEVNSPAFADAGQPVQFQVKAIAPSPCYEPSQASFRLDRDRNVILFHLSAHETAPNCEAKPTELSFWVNTGRLREGEYEIRELKSLKKWAEIQVDTPTASVKNSDLPKLELAIRKH